jgi:gas vesicle structural protein
MVMAKTRRARGGGSVASRVFDAPETSVLDLLDHVLNKGVVATGDVTLGVAGVDLVYVRLAALLCAADRVMPAGRKSSTSRHRRPPPRFRR